MTLTDVLPIKPLTHPLRGEVSVPGSKSLTNRALLLAALCDGPVVLSGALFSEDSRIMVDSLQRLGFKVTPNESATTIRVEGRGGSVPAEQANLFVGNAGTAARFLTALCAAAPRGVFKIDGVEQMRNRPMRGLIEALRAQGADIQCTAREGFLPIVVTAKGLRGAAVKIDAGASSQMLSAIMMTAPLAKTDTNVELVGSVREPFVDMTLAIMQRFSVTTRIEDGVFKIPTTPYKFFGPMESLGQGPKYHIEPDATAASYFLALPLAVSSGGSVRIDHLHRTGGLQGDIRFTDVLENTGVRFSEDGRGIISSIDRSARRPSVSQNFSRFSDTFLTLAALAPLLEGPTRITGIAHTRKQETDRVGNMAKELRKLGQEVVETEDALEIHPRSLPRTSAPVEIETYGDHRFAMSFGILGCHDRHGDGRPWLAIRDPGCCAKTFPQFFALLDSLRRESSEADGR